MPDPNEPIEPAPGKDAGEPPASTRMPAVYLGTGAPTLIDDDLWPVELAAWAAELPRPKAILVVSAHWQSAPLTLGAVNPSPLVYDFYGFPERYYRIRYDSPAAPDLAARVRAMMPANEPVSQRERGLDHGAYVPLLMMYPRRRYRSCRCRCRTSRPGISLNRRRLAPLRDEGILIMGSGFMTHGLPFVHQYFDGRPGAPEWSQESDLWAADVLEKGDLDALFDFRNRAPGDAVRPPHRGAFRAAVRGAWRRDGPYLGPGIHDHGYWLGLAKRSFQVR